MAKLPTFLITYLVAIAVVLGCGITPQVAVPAADKELPHCIVFGNTVTALCIEKRQQMCNIGTNMKIASIDPKHMSISGSFTTTNMIMANWSRSMWHSVVNRVVRMLASGPFASQFSSAFATVG
ncbi:hypothetical protein KIN20_025983 [Parelaphostrongylus tenuis]|uniref:Uncharacterized protein n=1 Tax=Parelaphostrongylus tenuis TaxID=148309 RepID=A0AAD5QX91_PARTN|nr:hypothetical protein KIN20_025983 [Parelaphostrongylus tenuis]